MIIDFLLLYNFYMFSSIEKYELQFEIVNILLQTLTTVLPILQTPHAVGKDDVRIRSLLSTVS